MYKGNRRAGIPGHPFGRTGEGGIDFQTKFGKTPMGTAQAVKAASPSCKVIALAGSVGDGIDQLYEVGIDAVFGISPGAISLPQAIAGTAENLARVSEKLARLIV
ncbi:glycerate kinase [Bifidobacterium aemilianum]|uniref:glycerate kinase n=1 Tax=Bifidobacterium aemilianum TaxID=2493120 RepID=UPI001F44EF46|nr:glycerate kinase [Bifidobacterium aemilianum]